MCAPSCICNLFCICRIVRIPYMQSSQNSPSGTFRILQLQLIQSGQSQSIWIKAQTLPKYLHLVLRGKRSQLRPLKMYSFVQSTSFNQTFSFRDCKGAREIFIFPKNIHFFLSNELQMGFSQPPVSQAPIQIHPMTLMCLLYLLHKG